MLPLLQGIARCSCTGSAGEILNLLQRKTAELTYKTSPLYSNDDPNKGCGFYSDASLLINY